MLSSHKNLAELCEIIIHEDNAEQKLFIRYLLLEFSLLFRKWYDHFLFSIKFGQYSLYHLKWALVSDMFSLLTLHFYCFYIYSLRLYQLWIYGLGELLNLFRGLKYNPLKVCSTGTQIQNSFSLFRRGWTLYLKNSIPNDSF